MPQAGYVYLVRGDRWHKIGRSKNPLVRLSNLNGLPFAVELVGVIPTEDMIALEAELHLKYANSRIRGEWFLLPEEAIAEILLLAKSYKPKPTERPTRLPRAKINPCADVFLEGDMAWSCRSSGSTNGQTH